jgi:drug/metabolite transporter (DMT)-like permease
MEATLVVSDKTLIRKVSRIGLLFFAIMAFIGGTVPIAMIIPDVFSNKSLPEQLPAFLIIAVVNYSFAFLLLFIRWKLIKKKDFNR